MSRGKRKIGLSMVLSMVILISTLPVAVWGAEPEQRWDEEQIAYLISEGVLLPAEDGGIRANQLLTRAELSSMLVRGFSLSIVGDVMGFVDFMPQAWYANAVSIAVGEKIIYGYGDNTLRPEAYITRQEVAVLLARTLKLAPSEEKLTQFIDESEIAPWAYESVAAMVARGDMHGYEDGTFRPKEYLLRGEAAEIIASVLQEREVIEAVPSQVLESYNLQNNEVLGNAESITEIHGNVSINGVGVKLENLIIYGNVIIQGSEVSGKVDLSGVVVQGAIFVVDGKIKGIDIHSSDLQASKVNDLNIYTDDFSLNVSDGEIEKVTFKGGGTTDIASKANVGMLIVDSEKEVLLSGKAPEIVIVSEANVKLKNAEVEILTIEEEAKGTKIDIDTSSHVERACVFAPMAFSGMGTIGLLEAAVPGVESTIQPQKGEGVDVSIADSGEDNNDSKKRITEVHLLGVAEAHFMESEFAYAFFLEVDEMPSYMTFTEDDFEITIDGQEVDEYKISQNHDLKLIGVVMDAEYFGAASEITFEGKNQLLDTVTHSTTEHYDALLEREADKYDFNAYFSASALVSGQPLTDEVLKLRDDEEALQGITMSALLYENEYFVVEGGEIVYTGEVFNALPHTSTNGEVYFTLGASSYKTGFSITVTE